MSHLVHEVVGEVGRPALADGVQAGGGGLDEEQLLPGVQHAGGQQQVVAVRLGVVLVAHVIHEPRPVPARHGDEAAAQEARHLARLLPGYHPAPLLRHLRGLHPAEARLQLRRRLQGTIATLLLLAMVTKQRRVSRS